MNKTAQTELYLVYLVERLPEPLTPASSHLQIFDSYIQNTRLRLRQIRDPYSKVWTRILQQRVPIASREYAGAKVAEIHLNDDEYELFKVFGGQEIRKNRYFHEFDRVSFTFDIYLGDLGGLTMTRVDFEIHEDMEAFIPPPFALLNVTNDPFFAGETLVHKQISDVRDHLRPIAFDKTEIAAE